MFASNTCFIKPSTSFEGKQKFGGLSGRSQHLSVNHMMQSCFALLYFCCCCCLFLSQNQSDYLSSKLDAGALSPHFLLFSLSCFFYFLFFWIVFISSFTCWSSTRLPPEQRQTGGPVLHLLTCFPLFHSLPSFLLFFLSPSERQIFLPPSSSYSFTLAVFPCGPNSPKPAGRNYAWKLIRHSLNNYPLMQLIDFPFQELCFVFPAAASLSPS